METTTAEPVTSSTAVDKPYPCKWPGCDRIGPRGFDSIPARTMHVIRLHTHRHIKRGKKAKSRAEKLAIQRKHNAAMRARNIAKGLTSAGKPRVGIAERGSPGLKPYQTKERKHEYYVRHRNRMAKLGLNAHGQPYKNNNLAKSQRNRRLREKAERVEYVWPIPPETQPTNPIAEVLNKYDASHPKHCPNCGENLGKWKKQI